MLSMRGLTPDAQTTGSLKDAAAQVLPIVSIVVPLFGLTSFIAKDPKR